MHKRSYIPKFLLAVLWPQERNFVEIKKKKNLLFVSEKQPHCRPRNDTILCLYWQGMNFRFSSVTGFPSHYCIREGVGGWPFAVVLISVPLRISCVNYLFLYLLTTYKYSAEKSLFRLLFVLNCAIYPCYYVTESKDWHRETAKVDPSEGRKID